MEEEIFLKKEEKKTKSGFTSFHETCNKIERKSLFQLEENWSLTSQTVSVLKYQISHRKQIFTNKRELEECGAEV